jgi:hypothetical protein
MTFADVDTSRKARARDVRAVVEDAYAAMLAQAPVPKRGRRGKASK